MTVLALTAGLTGVLGLLVGSLADGLAVGDLGCAHVGFDLELTQQTVNDDLQVQLAHAGDDGLTGLLVGVGLEGGVLLSQLGQGDAHLLVAGLGLGLDGHADDRLGELHRLEDDGVVLVAQGVAGGGILQAHNSRDIACVAAVDVLAVVGVHLQDTAHALAAVLHRVVDGGACLDLARVNAEVCQLADEGVGSDLEGQSSEGSLVGRRTGLGLLGLRIDALDILDIGGGGHIVHDRVQQLLDALVLVGRAADDGDQGVGDGLLADGGLQFLAGDLLALEVLLHQLLIVLGHSLDQDVVVFLGLLLHVVGDLLDAHVVAHIVVVDLGGHVDQVDDALEGVLTADGQLDGHAVGVQAVVQHLDAVEEVGAHGVHLVDVDHAGDLVFICLTPDRLGLGLDAALGSQNGDRTVQHAQRALHLDGEVDVARGVDDVDAMAVLLVRHGILLGLAVAPVAGGGSGSDGDAALLLLNHPVHRGCALMHLTDLVGDAGVVEDALGGGGLAGINVGHDADVSGHLKRNFSGCSHECTSSRSIAEMSKSLVGLSHLMGILALLHGGAGVVGGVHDLGSQTLAHGLFTTAAAVGSQPAQAQGLAAGGADLQGHLVVGAAHAAGLALEAGHDVLHGLLEDLQGIVAGLLLDHGESIINDLLSNALLAVQHDAVDKASNHLGIVNRIS